MSAHQSALVRFSHALNDALDKTVSIDPVFMSAADKTEALVQLERAQQRLHALTSSVLAVARMGEDACQDGAHRDTPALMAHTTHTDRARWSNEQRLADTLEQRWHATAHAWRQGVLSAEHVRVVTRALDDIVEAPDIYSTHVDDTVLAAAEEHLIDLAQRFTPTQLRRLAHHMFDVLLPDAAEDIEARKLDAMDQRAARAIGITFRRNTAGISGLSDIRIRTTDAIADRLKTYLDAFTNPRVTTKANDDSREPLVPFVHPDGEKIPHTRRLAMAFAQFLESADPHRMPIHGGDATHVVVTMTLDQLRHDLGGATHGLGDDQTPISAAHARRLACTAAIIPAVLGTNSEILDLGRSTRLFSRAQTRAMALRDQHCRADGCTVPAPWCEAHHLDPWSHGGRTDLENGRLLCRWHHQRVHDHHYRQEHMPNGDIRFIRRN